MDLGLNGRIVLVTGGSKGIGLPCAAAFIAEGCRVASPVHLPGGAANAALMLATAGLGAA